MEMHLKMETKVYEMIECGNQCDIKVKRKLSFLKLLLVMLYLTTCSHYIIRLYNLYIVYNL